MSRDPWLEKPGSALAELGRGPYLLPPLWELAYTLSSSEFPFSVFVSFLLTFFPSGIKSWMETMVTGWCGQPGPMAGVAGDSGAK